MQTWRKLPVPRSVLFLTEYLLLRAAMVLLLSIPYQYARRIISYLVSCIYRFDCRFRNVAQDNLSSAGITGVTPQDVYLHFALSFLQTLYLPRLLNRNNYRRYVTFQNEDVLKPQITQKDVLRDRGAILVGGHLGNWEAAIIALGLAGYPLNIVAWKQINPHIDEMLVRLRTSAGGRIIYTEGAIGKCLEALNRGEVIFILVDQTGRGEGVMVDFFGRPAPALWGAANLHLKTGAPIITFACIHHPAIRRDSAAAPQINYLLTFNKPIQYAATGDKEADIANITQQYIRELEGFIRQWPEQWIWFHRRWKQYK
ncbi:MAG: lysophospholipid acyltransferase family protein [Planctomycetes bacterium]|nr:lysophospholipid acyltransferase family protein [Planctomycetota bacterium]